jgi:hypothetical protein
MHQGLLKLNHFDIIFQWNISYLHRECFHGCDFEDYRNRFLSKTSGRSDVLGLITSYPKGRKMGSDDIYYGK